MQRFCVREVWDAGARVGKKFESLYVDSYDWIDISCHGSDFVKNFTIFSRVARVKG
jgi:hypothetical protein